MARRLLIAVAALALGFFAVGSGWGATLFHVTDLGTLGGKSSSAMAVNESGQVVGYSTTPSGDSHAFLYSGDRMTDLGTLGGKGDSAAYGINDAGQVVGTASTAGGAYHAFLYDGKGPLADLGTTAGCTNSLARAINANGQIVGYAYTLTGGGGGIILVLGTLSANRGGQTTFAFLDGTLPAGADGGAAPPSSLAENSWANCIGPKGQIVGRSGSTAVAFSGTCRAFLYRGGKMTALGTLGGANSYATGINESGQVTGSADDQSGHNHAFRYQGGNMIDLGALAASSSVADRVFLFDRGAMTDLGVLDDAPLSTSVPGSVVGASGEAFGVNRSGQIVGSATTAGGASHAFLYTGGVMIDLNAAIEPEAGWTLNRACAINDSGLIVGYGTRPSGAVHAFLLHLSPSRKPRPESWRRAV